MLKCVKESLLRATPHSNFLKVAVTLFVRFFIRLLPVGNTLDKHLLKFGNKESYKVICTIDLVIEI